MAGPTPIGGTPMRCTLFMRGVNKSWTETHWHRTPDIDYIAAGEAAQTLAVARDKLMGTDATVVSVRLSRDNIFRDSFVFVPEITGTTPDGPADPSADCIKVRATAGPNYRKTIFLAGYPDALSIASRFEPSPAWLDAFGVYRSLLLASWGFLAISRDLGDALELNNLAINVAVDGTVSVTLGGPGVGIFDQIRVKGVRGQGAQYLNGIWDVIENVGNIYRFKALGIPAGTDFQLSKFGKTAKRVRKVQAYTSLTHFATIISHKRGNRLFSPPGRLRKRKAGAF